MDIIPVLDIRGGIVVHAKRGERASYAPLRSGSTGSSEPVTVLHAMLDAIARIGLQARAVYVADLDAITGGTPQWDVISHLAEVSPVLLWVDAGFASAAATRDAEVRGLVPVVGSESLTTLAGLSGLRADGWILSLDKDADGPRDRAGILGHPELWPDRVIGMDLTRVGAETGGIGTWLETCMKASANKMWIAAGGVRDWRDVDALDAAGVAAALVATALHSGSLRRD